MGIETAVVLIGMGVGAAAGAYMADQQAKAEEARVDTATAAVDAATQAQSAKALGELAGQKSLAQSDLTDIQDSWTETTAAKNRALGLANNELSRVKSQYNDASAGLERSRVEAHRSTLEGRHLATGAAVAMGGRGGSTMSTLDRRTDRRQGDIQFEAGQQQSAFDRSLAGASDQINEQKATINDRYSEAERQKNRQLARIDQFLVDADGDPTNGLTSGYDLSVDAVTTGRDANLAQTAYQRESAGWAADNALWMGAVSGGVQGASFGMNLFSFGSDNGWFKGGGKDG